jgi:hypothetical protein
VAHVPFIFRSAPLFGTYGSATERDHVIYESRVKFANLLLADFDPAVDRIVAQPFLLRAEVYGQDACFFLDELAPLVGQRAAQLRGIHGDAVCGGVLLEALPFL